MRRLSSLGLGFVLLGCAQVALGAELITNGNFESFSSGLPTSWSYTQGDGPATLQNSANSPFTNIYPTGSNDLLFTDTAATGLAPIILQSFTSQSGTIYASWDFNFSSLTNGNYWVLQIDDAITAATRFDMDFTGGVFAFEESGVGFTPVTSLTANTWYQVTVALNIANDTLSGTITPQSGVSVPFSGSFRVTGVTSLSRLVFIDISAGDGTGQNANIQLDNVSVNTVAPVPEPSTIALSILAIGAGLIAQRIRRRAI
jgi:hypothetical protein